MGSAQRQQLLALAVALLCAAANAACGASALLASVSPAMGSPSGGIELLLSGCSLGKAGDVVLAKVGTADCRATTWVNASLVRCVLPRGVGPSLDVTLFVNGRNETLPRAFSYDEAVLASVSPASEAAGRTLTLKGLNFLQVPTLQCRFSSPSSVETQLVPAEFVDEETMRCTVPYAKLRAECLKDAEGCPVRTLAVTNDQDRWNSGLTRDRKVTWHGGSEIAPVDFFRIGIPAKLTIGVLTSDLNAEHTNLMAAVAAAVNADSNLLPFTTLELKSYDVSKARKTPAWAATQAAQALKDGAVSLVVDMSSDVAKTVLNHTKTVPVVGCETTASELSDSKAFPNFARVVASDTVQMRGIELLAEHFKWKRFALISDDKAVGSNIRDLLVGKDGSKRDTKQIPATFVYSNATGAAETAAAFATFAKSSKAEGIAVFVMAVAQENAAPLLRLARRNQLLNPGYVWVGTDSWGSESAYRAQTKETRGYMEGAMSVVPGVLTSGSGYPALIAAWRAQTAAPLASKRRMAYLYDAVTLATKSVHAVIRDSPIRSTTKAGVEKEYIVLLKSISHTMPLLRKIGFEGATGTIEHDKGNDIRGGSFEVNQFCKSAVAQIASISAKDRKYVAVAEPQCWLNTSCTETPLDEIHTSSTGADLVIAGIVHKPQTYAGFKCAVQWVNKQECVLGKTRLTAKLTYLDYKSQCSCRDGSAKPCATWKPKTTDPCFRLGLTAGTWVKEGQLLVNEAKVNGTGLVALIGPRKTSHTKVVLLDPVLTTVPIVSYKASAAELGNRKNFPQKFVRLIASESLPMGRVADIAVEFKWAQYATIAGNEAFGIGGIEEFELAAKTLSLRKVAEERFQPDNITAIREAFERIKVCGASVIVVSATSDQIAILLEAANATGLLRKEYTLMGGDSFFEQAMKLASKYPGLSILGTKARSADRTLGTPSGDMYAYLEACVAKLPGALPYGGPEFTGTLQAINNVGKIDSGARLAFDTVVAVARAADALERRGIMPTNATQLDAKIRDVEFTGATGAVSFFQGTNDRKGIEFDVTNLQGGKTVAVGRALARGVFNYLPSGCAPGEQPTPGAQEGTKTCEQCAIGKVKANWGDEACKACSEPLHSDSAGAVECKRCPSGSNSNGKFCVCKRGFFSRAQNCSATGNHNIANFPCKRWYSGSTCTACPPKFSDCPGGKVGNAPIYPLSGVWFDPTQASSEYAFPYCTEGNCLGLNTVGEGFMDNQKFFESRVGYEQDLADGSVSACCYPPSDDITFYSEANRASHIHLCTCLDVKRFAAEKSTNQASCCAAGHEGDLCAHCKTGFAKMGNGKCAKCSGSNKSAIVLAALSQIGICIYLLLNSYAVTSSAITTILIFFLQTTGLLAKSAHNFGLSAMSASSSWFRPMWITDLLNLDFESVIGQCVYDMSTIDRFYLKVVITPVLILIVTEILRCIWNVLVLNGFVFALIRRLHKWSGERLLATHARAADIAKNELVHTDSAHDLLRSYKFATQYMARHHMDGGEAGGLMSGGGPGPGDKALSHFLMGLVEREKVFVLAYLFQFAPLTRASLSILFCKNIVGRDRLLIDLDVVCWGDNWGSGSHWWAAITGIIVLLLTVFIIPSLFFFRSRRYIRQNMANAIKEKWQELQDDAAVQKQAEDNARQDRIDRGLTPESPGPGLAGAPKIQDTSEVHVDWRFRKLLGADPYCELYAFIGLRPTTYFIDITQSHKEFTDETNPLNWQDAKKLVVRKEDLEDINEVPTHNAQHPLVVKIRYLIAYVRRHFLSVQVPSRLDTSHQRAQKGRGEMAKRAAKEVRWEWQQLFGMQDKYRLEVYVVGGYWLFLAENARKIIVNVLYLSGALYPDPESQWRSWLILYLVFSTLTSAIGQPYLAKHENTLKLMADLLLILFANIASTDDFSKGTKGNSLMILLLLVFFIGAYATIVLNAKSVAQQKVFKRKRTLKVALTKAHGMNLMSRLAGINRAGGSGKFGTPKRVPESAPAGAQPVEFSPGAIPSPTRKLATQQSDNTFANLHDRSDRSGGSDDETDSGSE